MGSRLMSLLPMSLMRSGQEGEKRETDHLRGHMDSVELFVLHGFAILCCARCNSRECLGCAHNQEGALGNSIVKYVGMVSNVVTVVHH